LDWDLAAYAMENGEALESFAAGFSWYVLETSGTVSEIEMLYCFHLNM